MKSLINYRFKVTNIFQSLISRISRVLITFDGLYATLQLIGCTLEDGGTYKVVFSNEKGQDETSGKVNVKEVSYYLKFIYIFNFF